MPGFTSGHLLTANLGPMKTMGAIECISNILQGGDVRNNSGRAGDAVEAWVGGPAHRMPTGLDLNRLGTAFKRSHKVMG